MIAQIAEFMAYAGVWAFRVLIFCLAVSILFVLCLAWINHRAERRYRRERDAARDLLRAQRQRYQEHQAEILQFPVGSPITGSFRIGEKR